MILGIMRDDSYGIGSFNVSFVILIFQLIKFLISTHQETKAKKKAMIHIALNSHFFLIGKYLSDIEPPLIRTIGIV